jgi:hypothetical protein
MENAPEKQNAARSTSSNTPLTVSKNNSKMEWTETTTRGCSAINMKRNGDYLSRVVRHQHGDENEMAEKHHSQVIRHEHEEG